MSLPPHGDVTTAANLHRIGVIQAADPGAIGAGKAWIDSDDGAVRVRNVADSGWLGPFATAADITTAINALINAAPGALDTLDELAAALGDDASFAATVTTALALKAPLASPALTGTPTVPTAAPGTNTTQAASTAFVTAAVAAGPGGGGAGGLVLLESQTASSSAQLDFGTRNAAGQSGALFQSDYDEYEIHVEALLPATNLANFQLRFSVAAAIDTGNNYVEDIFVWRAGGTGSGGSATLHGQISMLFSGTSNTATHAVSGKVTLHEPLSTAIHKQLIGRFRFHDGTFRALSELAATYVSVSAVDGFRILASSGNLASGTVRVYGVAK